MSYNLGYWDDARGSRFRSYAIGGKAGPVIYQGANSPVQPDVAKSGDLWIQTGVTPTLQQYVDGEWTILGAGAGGTGPQGPAGPAGANGIAGADGADGIDGVSVSNAVVNGSGNLILTLSDNSVITAGSVYPTAADTAVLYVSKFTGFSGAPNGSASKPFPNPQAAHDWALANISNAAALVIRINPGSYPEALTISRAKTFVRGYNGKQAATGLSGGVTVNMANATGDWTTHRCSVEEVQVTNLSGGTIFAVTGASPVGLYINKVKLFSETPSQICFLANNTVAAGVRLEIDDCDFQSQANAVVADFSNVAAGSTYKRILTESGTAPAMRFRSGYMTCSDLFIGSTGSNAVIQIDAGTLNMSGSIVYNNAPNTDGVVLATGAQYFTSGTFYNVPTGSGFVIRAAAGSSVYYSSTTFQANTKISSNATVVALPTTFTPA
jgi:hypothetical protein